jgi:hypothetical protein
MSSKIYGRNKHKISARLQIEISAILVQQCQDSDMIENK